MDASARHFGEAERAKQVKIRDEAQVIIDYWNKALGDSGPTTTEIGAGGAESAFQGPTGGAAVDFVAEAELIGKSAPKATRLIMERMKQASGMNRPLRVADIHAALVKGGMSYKKDQLYTTLTRSPMFHSPAKGLWGLVEWYPNAKKTTKIEDDPVADPLQVIADETSDDAVA